jgi:hypothetical protein
VLLCSKKMDNLQFIKTIVDTHILSIMIKLKQAQRNSEINDEFKVIDEVQNELIECVQMLEQLKVYRTTNTS